MPRWATKEETEAVPKCIHGVWLVLHCPECGDIPNERLRQNVHEKFLTKNQMFNNIDSLRENTPTGSGSETQERKALGPTFKAVDGMWTEGEYLKYKDDGLPSKGARTHKYLVYHKVYGMYLGFVKWMPTWRQFAFWPATGGIFDKKCLREVAEFCEVRTLAQREKNEEKKRKEERKK